MYDVGWDGLGERLSILPSPRRGGRGSRVGFGACNSSMCEMPAISLLQSSYSFPSFLNPLGGLWVVGWGDGCLSDLILMEQDGPDMLGG